MDVPFDPVIVLFIAAAIIEIVVAFKVSFVRKNFIPIMFVSLLGLVAVDHFFGSSVRTVIDERNTIAKEVTYQDTHTLFGLEFTSDERTRVEQR